MSDVDNFLTFLQLSADWEKAVRAFMIMSCIAGGLSILTAILSYLGKVPNTFTAIALAITGENLSLQF